MSPGMHRRRRRPRGRRPAWSGVRPPAAVDARDHGVGFQHGLQCVARPVVGQDAIDAREPPDPDRLLAEGRAAASDFELTTPRARAGAG